MKVNSILTLSLKFESGTPDTLFLALDTPLLVHGPGPGPDPDPVFADNGYPILGGHWFGPGIARYPLFVLTGLFKILKFKIEEI